MTRFRNILIAGALLSPAAALADSKASINGSAYKTIEISPEASTGLNNIFVAYNTAGCHMTFKTSNGHAAVIYRFSSLGGAYAEEVRDADRETGSVTIALTGDDSGYILEEGTSRYYCWVVNYANHYMTLNSITPAGEQDCDYTILEIDGNASAITYYTINGQPRTLSREITLNYTTQEFNEEIPGYAETETSKTYESTGNKLSVSPPAYCTTYFTLTGDRFLREWGMEATAETYFGNPTAVACKTEAEQENPSSDEPSNIMGGDTTGLGGSAPSHISFYSYTTEATAHYEWQLSRNQEFTSPDYRFYQRDLDYTFDEEGTYYIKFIGSNADGTCETEGEVYTVSIGASALEIPNAFSPNGDGINDVWKVSYRSLTDFHCEIFNRNGQRIYGFNDPAGGWDGTWHGKNVNPGVYYYVISATGADGKKYKKSGDINIIRSVNYGSSSVEPAE